MSLPPSSAPTATGWSDSCRAGFAPAEERRLSRRTLAERLPLPRCPAAQLPIRLMIRRVPRSRCLGLNPSGSAVCHDASSVRRYPASARAVRSRCASVAAAACRRQADGDDPEDPTDERYAAARPRVRAGPTQGPVHPAGAHAPGRRPCGVGAGTGQLPVGRKLSTTSATSLPLPSAMALTMAYAELGLCVGRTQRGEGGGDGDLHRPRRWRGAPVSASSCDVATGPNPRRSRTASDAPRSAPCGAAPPPSASCSGNTGPRSTSRPSAASSKPNAARARPTSPTHRRRRARQIHDRFSEAATRTGIAYEHANDDLQVSGTPAPRITRRAHTAARRRRA